MTDQTTPVTDDDRQAHEWADHQLSLDVNDEVIVTAARAIKAHVPAPPKSLADEIRGADWNGLGDKIMAERFADRVAAVERELAGHKRDYAECQQELIASEVDLVEAQRERDEVRAAEKAVQRACDDWEAEARKVRGDLDEARAEVERLKEENAEMHKKLGYPNFRAFLGMPPATALPDPADVPDGEAWEVVGPAGRAVGFRDGCLGGEWAIAYPGGDGSDDVGDQDVTLVARLVPDTRHVIDKPEDLDELPVDSVVLDDDGNAWQKSSAGTWDYGHNVETTGDFLTLCGPVTVIHVPEVAA